MGRPSHRRIPATLVAVAVAAVASGTGCALKPPPAHDASLAEALPSTTRVPDGWVSDAAAGPVANGWLAELDDPQLDALVAEAMRNNPDLREAAARVIAAQQAAVIAGSRLYPWVGAYLGADVTHDDDGNTNDATKAYLGVGWEIDVWGRLRAQRAAAEADAASVALDYAWARQSLAATVARLWYLNVEANQMVDLAAQAVAVYGKLTELVQVRAAAGKVSSLDVTYMRAKLESSNSSLEAARAAQASAKRGLETLLGRYPSAEIETATQFLPLSPPPAADVPGAMLLRRPDLLAAEQDVLATFRREEAAELSLLPEFSLSLAAGRLGDQVLALLDVNPWLTAAGVGASVPIYQGGRLEANVAIATANQQAAVAGYGRAVLDAFREVEDALDDDAFYAARVPWETRALADRTETVRIANLQYTAGRIDLMWVGELQTAQIENQQDLITLVTQQRINRVRMYLALGASYDAEPAARVAASR